ncbi:hypothetical protein [Microcoleus sp. S28C3]|uniref:hypothetical protein n=1 Tax=Microcoleus sp. S28C3 TaxID=3055414 RepID=UPI002FD63B27
MERYGIELSHRFERKADRASLLSKIFPTALIIFIADVEGPSAPFGFRIGQVAQDKKKEEGRSNKSKGFSN